ncbi:membrane protein [Pullulanibacillus camelliae]|uniref:Membrane protein n=1 Tax=Pullulanibacillus camelliae TaxID=1707096 RepID=A0A8J2YP28_9BACL|nr:YndM family protein [Pullulanibacillus camelliae]GGE56584.1 membrane protein [Pullulanibacillus camelliae]
MQQIGILLIKWLTCILAFTIALDLFFNATLIDILSFSLAVTLISYFIGDRLILPLLGNRIASISDFILTYVSVWVFGSILLNNYMQVAWGSLISAVLISFAEIFIHRFILNHTPNREAIHKRSVNGLDYSTEFSEDQDPDKKNNG